MSLDLSNSCLNCSFVSGTVNDRCVFLINNNSLCCSEHLNCCVLKLFADLFADEFSACENCDILKHGLSSVTESRSFYSCDIKNASELIYNECCKRFAFNVLSNDEERFSVLRNAFKQRNKVFKACYLLIENKDKRIVHLNEHLLSVCNKVRTEISAVELHTFNCLKVCLHSFSFFNCDNAFFSNFIHRFGDDLSNFLIVVR